MLTGLSTVATRRIPPRFCVCASAARGPMAAPAASPAVPASHCRRVNPSCVSFRSLIARPSPGLLLDRLGGQLNDAVFDHEAHVAHRLDVLQRIALHPD